MLSKKTPSASVFAVVIAFAAVVTAVVAATTTTTAATLAFQTRSISSLRPTTTTTTNPSLRIVSAVDEADRRRRPENRQEHRRRRERQRRRDPSLLSSSSSSTRNEAGEGRGDVKITPGDDNNNGDNGNDKWMASMAASAVILATAMAPLSTATTTANAYDPTDYASETVQSALQSLRDATSATTSSSQMEDAVFRSYEEIADIITEGKGVGGSINYKGVQLDRGYVADEDTEVYNPGLTLLTESEKERLVEGILSSRRASLSSGRWSNKNQLAFEFLKDKLDPYHVSELRGYLAALPFYAAAVYLGVFAVQRVARDLFPAAYIAGVVAVFAPAFVLVLLGPQ